MLILYLKYFIMLFKFLKTEFYDLTAKWGYLQKTARDNIKTQSTCFNTSKTFDVIFIVCQKTIF